MTTDRYLDIRVEVAAALAAGRPVVALESTVLAHGLPHPTNLQAAEAMDAAVRSEGAVPATTGILDGRAVVGLTSDEVRALATEGAVVKVSVRDLAPVVSSRLPGATTVAATAALATSAGISVMATGGIGGVHRGGASRLDISADLAELARAGIVAVCAGAKSILDLPRTLEVLETLGVPVIGFGTDVLPAFCSADSGIRLEHRRDSPDEIAALLEVQRNLGRSQSILVVQPPPPEHAVARLELDEWTEAAMREASRRDVTGKDLTPFLLERMAEASHGRTLRANVALLEANAGLAARIAVALC